MLTVAIAARVQCDGDNYQDLLRQKKVEAVVLLNISSYAGGTRPWGTKQAVDRFAPPRMDDGLIEVLGFASAWDMAKGQMGVGHALRICQCRRVVITTLKPLPVQVVICSQRD